MDQLIDTEIRFEINEIIEGFNNNKMSLIEVLDRVKEVESIFNYSILIKFDNQRTFEENKPPQITPKISRVFYKSNLK